VKRENISRIVLSAKHITVSGENHIVYDASLILPSHTVMLLMGMSGSGKSLFLQGITGFFLDETLRLCQGKVTVEGEEIWQAKDGSVRLNREALGDKIALSYQEAGQSLNPRLKCRHQLRLLLRRFYSTNEIPAEMERANEFLRVSGIEPERVWSNYPCQLSGGLQQMAYLALALRTPARVLLLDEIFSNMDSALLEKVTTFLAHHVHDTGRSLLVVTHDPSLISGFAHYVAIFYSGRIIEIVHKKDKPLHPFTRYFFACFDENLTAPIRQLISANAPGTRDKISSNGCSYRHQCKQKINKCDTTVPPLRECKTENGHIHFLACFNPFDNHEDGEYDGSKG